MLAASDSAIPLVHQAWQRCTDRLLPPLSTEALQNLFARFIYTRYTEPQRHYHNLQHLEEMLGYLAQYEREHGWHGIFAPALSAQPETAGSPPAATTSSSLESGVDLVPHDWTGTVLLLAILFHDVVYDPTRPDNEEKSAEVAEEFLNTAEQLYTASRGNVLTASVDMPSPELLWTHANTAQFVRDTTRDYILKTKVHLSVAARRAFCLAAPPTADEVAESRDDPLHVFLDLDLSILGQADPKVYRERYAANIQREYSHHPRADFVKGRSAFLRGFLENPQWFKTAYFFTLLEAQARRNVEGEVAELTSELKTLDVAAIDKTA